MEGFEAGQVWQRPDNKYGHICMWEVTQMGARSIILRNMATRVERCVIAPDFPHFFELNELTAEKGWGPDA